MLAPPPLPRTLEAAVRDLGSHRPQTRVSSVQDLVRHAAGDEAVRARALPLIEARLADDSPAVRAAAAVALGDLAATGHVPSLLARVEDDDAYVRQMAINALGELGDPRALLRLRRALTDPRPEVRYQAVIAYARLETDAGEIDDALAQATRDEDLAIAHIALRVAEERLDAGHPLSATLHTRAKALVEGGPPGLALVAAICLAKAGDAAGRTLVAMIAVGGKPGGQAPETEDEQAAVELAGVLDLRETIPALERRVWGLGRFVKDTCAFHARIALARMGHERARAEIVKDLGAAREAVRAAAVVAAGRGRVTEARAAIEALPTGSVDPALVREALAALERTTV